MSKLVLRLTFFNRFIQRIASVNTSLTSVGRLLGFLFYVKRGENINRQQNTACFLFDIKTIKYWFICTKIFFLKIEFQNSIQDWVFLPCNGTKKVLRIKPGYEGWWQSWKTFQIFIEKHGKIDFLQQDFECGMRHMYDERYWIYLRTYDE